MPQTRSIFMVKTSGDDPVFNAYKCIRYFLGVMLAMVSLAACGLSGGPENGMVIDASTNKPVEGAIVTARWIGHMATWAHGSTSCYHVESTTTDKDGEFHIPKWKQDYTEDWQKNVSPRYVDITVYLPGYQQSPRQIEEQSALKGIYYLEVFKGSREERLEDLVRLTDSTRCGESDISESNLLPLKKALYEEAKSIALTTEGKKKVEILLFGLESLELGDVEALDKMTERRKTPQ